MFKKKKILKRDGKSQDFSKAKILLSLQKSGLNEPTANKTLEKILDQVSKKPNNLSTRRIRSLATKSLKKLKKRYHYNYNFKKSLYALGPDGFTFEKYLAQVLSLNFERVLLNQLKKGCCVNHEVDIVLTNCESEETLIECKFHNSKKNRNNIKIPLYINSRFIDINYASKNLIKEYWIISNTKFSSDAIKYAECVGIKLLTPEYPQENSLSQIISNSGIYPITCLHSFSKITKNLLLSNGIISISDFLLNESKSKKIIGPELFSKGKNEAEVYLKKDKE